MRDQRPIAAAYEAQPIIEALILICEKDHFDQSIFSVGQVRDLLSKHFGARPSVVAVSEAFDEGFRLGAWNLIGKEGESNHIEVSRITISFFAEALRSQRDSTFYALEKVGEGQLKAALARARQASETDSVKHPELNRMVVALKRLEHNAVFQRGLAATRQSGRVLAESPPPKGGGGFNWTKSGAIAAWIGIPLAAIAAIAAIIALWK